MRLSALLFFLPLLICGFLCQKIVPSGIFGLFDKLSAQLHIAGKNLFLGGFPFSHLLRKTPLAVPPIILRLRHYLKAAEFKISGLIAHSHGLLRQKTLLHCRC